MRVQQDIQDTVDQLKSTYFMFVIDGVFCLDARVGLIYKSETLSVVRQNTPSFTVMT